MEMAHTKAETGRTALLGLALFTTLAVLTTVAMMMLGIDIVPALTWPTTNIPVGGGGSEAYWYESSNADPLWAYYKYA